MPSLQPCLRRCALRTMRSRRRKSCRAPPTTVAPQGVRVCRCDKRQADRARIVRRQQCRPAEKGRGMRKLLPLPLAMLTLPAAMCERREPSMEIRTVELSVPALCLPANKILAGPGTVSHLLTGDEAADLSIGSASALNTAHLRAGDAHVARRLQEMNS